MMQATEVRSNGNAFLPEERYCVTGIAVLNFLWNPYGSTDEAAKTLTNHGGIDVVIERDNDISTWR